MPPDGNQDRRVHVRVHGRRGTRANLYVHHGRFDESVPYTHTTRLIAEIEKHRPERCFHEIFDGGHEIRYDVAFRWFDALVGQQPAPSTATG